MGNPVLLQKAAPVDDPTAAEIRRLAADMQDTIEDIGASGLAAGGADGGKGGNRNDLAGIGRNHRILVQIIEFLARGRANAFGSKIGFGHVQNPGNVGKAELHLAS